MRHLYIVMYVCQSYDRTNQVHLINLHSSLTLIKNTRISGKLACIGQSQALTRRRSIVLTCARRQQSHCPSYVTCFRYNNPLMHYCCVFLLLFLFAKQIYKWLVNIFHILLLFKKKNEIFEVE